LSERWIAVPAYFASGVIVPHLHPEMLIASGRNAPQFKWRDAAATRVKNTRIRMAAAGHYIQDLQYRCVPYSNHSLSIRSEPRPLARIAVVTTAT